MKALIWKGALAAAALMSTVVAQAIIIDDFSSGAYSITANSVNPSAQALRSGSMVGGWRDAMLSWTSGPNSVNATVDLAAGAVQFFNGDSETSGSLLLSYNGNNGGPPSLGLDLSGDDRFLLDFRFVDAGISSNLALTITVVTSTGTFTANSVVANGLNFTHTVMFSDFTGVNWADVQGLSFQFDSGPAGDFTLDNIRTSSIPGPLAVVPFLIGAGALSRRRR